MENRILWINLTYVIVLIYKIQSWLQIHVQLDLLRSHQNSNENISIKGTDRMAKRNRSNERRKHDRITIKNNVFTALGADSKQKCVVLDISVGGLSLRYYEGSELIKQITDDKSSKLDLFIEKGDLCLSQIPFKTVYDAEIENELPLESVTIRKRGVKFGRLSRDQRSKLNELVQKRLTK